MTTFSNKNNGHAATLHNHERELDNIFTRISSSQYFAKNHNLSHFIQSWKSGFNANDCQIIELSESSMRMISDMILSQKNSECIHKLIYKMEFISKQRESQDQSLPTNFIFHFTRNILPINTNIVGISLPQNPQIKSILGTRQLSVSLNIVDPTLGYEMPSDEYDFEHDIVFTIDEIQRMKVEEQEKWQNLLGEVEYNLLVKNIIRILLALDRQISDIDARAYATRAISICSGWNSAVVYDQYVKPIVQKMFSDQKEHEKFLILPQNNDTNEIQCHFGKWFWSDYGYEFGIILELKIVYVDGFYMYRLSIEFQCKYI